jgi:hypothetical protein
VQAIYQSIIPQKTTMPNVYFPKDCTMIRAFIYSLVCDSGSNHISVEALLAGSNRYGVDNPCPIINKRMSLYGVTDDLEKDFKKLVERYNKMNLGFQIDPEVHPASDLKMQNKMDSTNPRIGTTDFKETEVASPLKKKAGILNMNLLKYDTFESFGQRDDISNTSRSPLKFKGSISSEVNRVSPDHWIGGVQMKIANVKHIHESIIKPEKLKKKKRDIFATRVETPKRNRKVSPPKSFGGMSTSAYVTHQVQKKDLTNFEIGVNADTKIIVPSFSTTSKIFS